MGNRQSSSALPRIMLILSMSIFGSVGIFKKYISMPSELIAFARSFIGVIFILLFLLARGRKISFADIKRNLLPLTVSGIMLGFNWILFFEAINSIGVPTATICYYLSPVFIMAASPLILGERLTLKKTICILLALTGMVFVSDILTSGAEVNFTGLLLGIGAAVLYASIVITNKKTTGIAAYDKTAVQLGICAAVMLVYSLVVTDYSAVTFSAKNIILLTVIGCVHTGLAYTLYFAALERLPAQTVSLFSYIDPVLACVLASVLFPAERMNALQIAGAVIILGATLVCEINIKPKGRKNKNA